MRNDVMAGPSCIPPARPAFYVRRIYSGCGDPHEDLALSRLWSWHIAEIQHIGWTEAVIKGGEHRVILSNLDS
jgi:hypothetical protein